MDKSIMKKLRISIMFLLLAAALILTPAISAQAASYDSAGATSFVFSDEGVTVKEGTYTDYEIEGTALIIKGSGTYIVSGSCADGSITVKKGTADVVLVLDGLTLSSSDTAPIACNKSTAVTIVAAAGSVNTLSDSEYNNDEEYPDNENAENAVIKCKDGSQVTICGSGTINIIANGKNGVKGGASTDEEGEAWLNIEEVTLNITANVNDGLKSDQLLNILSGNITVSAADDAIKSDYVLNIGAEGTEGPVINILKSNEGIEAATINIYSGDITVNADDDGINAANSDLTGYSFAFNIYGGRLYVNVTNGDGIDSNGALNIAGGVVEVFSSAQNDNSALDSDGVLTLSGGTVLAVGSSGMAQTPNNASQAYLLFGSSGMGGGFMRGGFNTQQGASAINIQAGDSIDIVDSAGNTLYSAKAVRTASSVFFSSAELKADESYSLQVNGKEAASLSASAAGGGNMGGMPAQMGSQNQGFGGPGSMNGQKPAKPGDMAQAPALPEQPASVPAQIADSAAPQQSEAAEESDNKSDMLKLGIWLAAGAAATAAVIIGIIRAMRNNKE